MQNLQTNCNILSARETRIINAKNSQHAAKRSRQRGMDNCTVPLILAFGVKEHDGRGGVRCLMTQSAMEKLYGAVGKTKHAESLAGKYVVISSFDNTVITVGHRH